MSALTPKADIFGRNMAFTRRGVADRKDPITELIAKAIVNVTATGERNSELVRERAINALGILPRAA